jgi:hypothetical protein
MAQQGRTLTDTERAMPLISLLYEVAEGRASPEREWAAVVLAIIAAICLLVVSCGITGLAWAGSGEGCEYGAFGCGHAENHELYKNWNERPIFRNGVPAGRGSCCSGQDCRPVRANQDVNGNWKIWIPEWRDWVKVPPAAVGVHDRFHDGRSHACTSTPYPDRPGKYLVIYCFSPAEQKS